MFPLIKNETYDPREGSVQADRNSRRPLHIMFGAKTGEIYIQLGPVMVGVIG